MRKSASLRRRAGLRYGTPACSTGSHIVGDAPRVLARRPAGEAFTLVHGDAHRWNCLVPRQGTSGEVGLIDREDRTIGPATTDLACMMAMLCFPDMRCDLERIMLDAYRETVEQAGVAGFGREALTDGYRWSVVLQTLRPFWRAMHGVSARVWWPNLERNSLAFDDLNCEEPLG